MLVSSAEEFTWVGEVGTADLAQHLTPGLPQLAVVGRTRLGMLLLDWRTNMFSRPALAACLPSARLTTAGGNTFTANTSVQPPTNRAEAGWLVVYPAGRVADLNVRLDRCLSCRSGAGEKWSGPHCSCRGRDCLPSPAQSCCPPSPPAARACPGSGSSW